MATHNEQRLSDSGQEWDEAAATFDNEPDHGLLDPAVRKAWRNLLVQWLPPEPASILDIGCGTGSLSLVLAELGYQVTGIDLSTAMIARAKTKVQTAGYQVNFKIMDATDPQLSLQQFDGVVCRHVLWSLQEPAQVLQRWVQMLAPGGRLLLIEGFWKTGSGLHAQEILEILPPVLEDKFVQDLSNQPVLWGGEVSDERYLVIASLAITP